MKHPFSWIVLFFILIVYDPSLCLGESLIRSSAKKFTKPGIALSLDRIHKPAFADIYSPYWTPSPSDIEELESLLGIYLSKAKEKRAKHLALKIYSYGRQYLGASSSSGKRIILVNGFCQALGLSNSELKQKWVEVDDGGDCYFQLFYHPDQKSFSSLQINGDG